MSCYITVILCENTIREIRQTQCEIRANLSVSYMVVYGEHAKSRLLNLVCALRWLLPTWRDELPHTPRAYVNKRFHHDNNTEPLLQAATQPHCVLQI